MEPQQLHHHRLLKYKIDLVYKPNICSQIHVQNIAEAFSKHLAAETKYLSSLLHVETNKASSTEPTGTTLLQAATQMPSVPVSQKWGQTLSTNYSVGLNGRGLLLTQSMLTKHVDP